MTVSDWIAIFSLIVALISVAVALISVAITACVALYAIRKTAQENRISYVHSELVKTLVEIVIVINRILDLLHDVAKQVTYSSIIDDKFIETAYDRYWREISELSKSYKTYRAKHNLLFPKQLYKALERTLKKVNQAKYLVLDVKPDDNHVYQDTSKLEVAVDDAIDSHIEFVHACRRYIGANKIDPMSFGDDLLLSEEKEKIIQPN